MKKKIFVFSLILLLFSVKLFSQQKQSINSNNTKPKLPTGFKNIFLGMTLQETKEELLRNPDFGYHGDRDVSLVPGSNQILIETDTSSNFSPSFLTQSWFQFYEDKLYIMTINFNRNKIDYYSIFTTLSKKYGEPNSLDPQKSVWQNKEVTVILEKPLSIKYIDRVTYDELSNYSNISKSAEENVRQMFLDEF